MTNLDPNTPSLPLTQNINIVALATAVIAVAVAFGLPLTVDQKTSILALVAIVGPSLMALLHTFVNHPANQVKAAQIVNRAVSVAKRNAGVLALFLVMGLGFLGACSILGAMTPQDDLNATEALFATAEATYDALCSVNQPPGFCADQADYAKAKAVLEAAFQTAQVAITASGNLSTASVQNLIAVVVSDWNAYNQIVATTKAKAIRAGVHVPT